MTIKLDIAEDFHLTCEIFKINPQIFLQEVVSKISLPYFYSHPNTKKQWATMLFLEHLMLIDKPNDEVNIDGRYLDEMYNTVNTILSNNGDDVDKAEVCARKILNEWHRAVIAKRAEYLIRKLP